MHPEHVVGRVAATIRERRKLRVGIIGIACLNAVAIPHPDNLIESVVAVGLKCAVRIDNLCAVAGIVVGIAGRVAFTICFAYALVQLIVGNMLGAFAVCAFDDTALFIVER